MPIRKLRVRTRTVNSRRATARMFDSVFIGRTSRRRQRPLLGVERADALDEDLLERRVGDLEAEDVAAVRDGRPQDGLRIGAGVDPQLGEVVARAA